MRETLESKGYKVLEADHGAAALQVRTAEAERKLARGDPVAARDVHPGEPSRTRVRSASRSEPGLARDPHSGAVGADRANEGRHRTARNADTTPGRARPGAGGDPVAQLVRGSARRCAPSGRPHDLRLGNA